MLTNSLQALKLFTLLVLVLFILGACSTTSNPQVSPTSKATITANTPALPSEDSILRFGYEIDATNQALQLVSVNDKAVSDLDTQAALNATHLAFKFSSVQFPVQIVNPGDIGTMTVDFEFDNKADNVWTNLKVKQVAGPNGTADATKVILKVPNGDSDISIGKEFVNTCFLPAKDTVGEDDATFDGTDSFILAFEVNYTTPRVALYIDVIAEAADSVIGFDSLCGAEQNNSSQSVEPPPALDPDTHTFPGTEVDAFNMQNTPAHADDSGTTPNPLEFVTNPLNIFHDTSQKYEPFFLARDVDNPQNPKAGQDPEGEVSWDFDISGVTNLKLFVDIAAKGDFEASDVFELTYQIDGGVESDAITFAVDEAGSQTYQLFNDDPTSPKIDVLFDPLTITDDTGTTTTSNIFKTYTAVLTGTGSSIKIRFKVVQDGGNEMVALKNLFVTGSTVP